MKKNNFIQFMVLAVTLLAVVFMGGNSPQVKATTAADKTYIIGTDTTFAPFEYQNEEGEMVGIDMDILKAIAEDQGFDYELRILGFNAALQAVESGQVDGMIAGMGITEEREKSFDFSEPYFNAGVVFAAQKANAQINSLDDLAGKKVAAKTGTAGFDVATDLAEQYGYEVTVFEDSANMYEDVMVGNSDVAVEDYPVMAYAISDGGLDLKVISDNLEATDYGFAVKDGENAELVKMFNAGLANIQASGEYDEILQNYLGENAPEPVSASSTDKPGAGLTYVIGTDTTFAPFEFVDEDGEFVGIDIDILDAIAADQGFQYELNILGFNAAIQAVESGQVDGMIAGMGITAEREQSFDFSNPYFNAGVVFAARADNADIDSLEDLQGKTIAAKTGTAGFEVATELAEQYGYEVTVFEDSANMYEDVTVGNSDAAVEDMPVMAYAINNGGLDLKIISDDLEATDYGFAVKDGENPELIAMFNTGLANIQASGEYDQILNRYIGADAEETAANDGFFSQIANNSKALLGGLWSTIWVSLVSIAIATVLGVIIGLMRTGENSVLSGIAGVYIDIMRGIPIIVLAFFIYFGIPQMTGSSFPATVAGIATLGLNASAYIAEIVRGGILAIPKGQREAARSLGLNNNLTMKRVILPQAIRVMVPSFINQFVITLKDSSILSVIGLVELTQTGKIIIARTYQSGAMWLIIGIMYLIVITILTKTSNWVESKFKIE